MPLSMPCNFYMLSINTCAIVETENEWLRLTKCAYFVSLSNTAKIIDLPCDLKSPSTKSIMMPENTPNGIDKGCNKPRDNIFCAATLNAIKWL